MAEKADIPVVCTLLGLSSIPSNHPLYKGMAGMHGNIGPNVNTNKCDVLIAIGMRFDDRVTGDTSKYAPQAKIVHIDIDPSEFNKTYAPQCLCSAMRKRCSANSSRCSEETGIRNGSPRSTVRKPWNMRK